MKKTTTSPIQTKNLAKQIAKNFNGGQILGLVGDLGSGKTQFTKGLAEYYKIKNHITSPTFVLMKIYHIKDENIKKLIHIDCYRLNNSQELLALGLEEIMADKNNLVVIEWAERIKNILPTNTLWIKFKIGKKENERIINL